MRAVLLFLSLCFLMLQGGISAGAHGEGSATELARYISEMGMQAHATAHGDCFSASLANPTAEREAFIFESFEDEDSTDSSAPEDHYLTGYSLPAACPPHAFVFKYLSDSFQPQPFPGWPADLLLLLRVLRI